MGLVVCVADFLRWTEGFLVQAVVSVESGDDDEHDNKGFM